MVENFAALLLHLEHTGHVSLKSYQVGKERVVRKSLIKKNTNRHRRPVKYEMNQIHLACRIKGVREG